MVIGDAENPGKMLPQPSAMPSPANIDNIMSGISNTGSVKMNNHRKKLRQRFDIIKKLGQGTYGKVQLGINKETGQEVAIKTIKKCKIETEADLIRIRREVQIMSSVQHPNIIHIYEVFENREKMVLVMEFAAGGELYDYLSERKVLSEDEARRVFRQISTAVYYCHKHKICHRDLKLENILLDENGNAKIADFGLSNVFDEQRQLATFCGSPLYASPEIVKGTPYQGPEVDCWSLGVLLYTLVYGAMPFDGSNFKRLVKQISSGDYYEPKKPSPASPLIREMLTVCPKRRASIENICNHWWVNEGYKESCLDLAEELANQTPVRLDVLLSLAPPSVTADQLVVPGSNEEAKPADRVARSHSVGSIRDMGNTEAERRILDMVAAGGEAALAPSPTRTITPAESPAQAKRKLESTVSTESVHGGAKKKEKPTELLRNDPSRIAIAEDMEVEQVLTDVQVPQAETIESKKVEDVICDKQLESSESFSNLNINKTNVVEQKPEFKFEKSLTKSTTKDTSDTTEAGAFDEKISPQRKNSLTEESLIKNNERRKSRIFEAAEKFQNMSNLSSDKPKKFVLPGVSVGGFKKEFERKASLTSIPTPGERKSLEKRSESLDQTISRKNSLEENADHAITPVETKILNEEKTSPNDTQSLKSTENKGSLANFSLEEARRSMENSIALLNAAKTESSKELDQLCAQTEDVAVSEDGNERQQKLKLARETIGNAIKPGRLCMGVRKPPVPFGLNGRSVSGSVVPSSTLSPVGDMRSMRLKVGPEPSDIRTANFSVSSPEHRLYNKEPLVQQKPSAFGVGIADPQNNNMKTSRAEITLKSATLPRRKPAKSEIQFELLPKQEQPSMRFQTEIQHQLPDLRSAPIREHSGPYSPLEIQNRASSLEPQKEHVIPIQRPQTSYSRTGSNSFKPTLSRQSTNDSDTESTATMTTASQSTITGSKSGASQPIKKSPREFIIPIAVEGGGFLTPRAGSLEPSESNSTAGGSFSSRISRQRRIGSLLNDRDSEDENPFSRLHRHTSLNRDSDIDDQPRFAMHRLRSTRPIKKSSTDPNDSASSGEEDDDDGFEILTAENLFSTLLSRVRALTNRLNVNNDPSSSFPSSRLMSNLRQPHSPFWHNDPFASRLNNGSNSWRHSMARDLTSDIDSMFSRSGATLPRVGFRVSLSHVQSPPNPISAGVTKNHTIKQTETESL